MHDDLPRPPTKTLFLADAGHMASFVDAASVDLVVTSPPYGLADYGTDDGQLSRLENHHVLLEGIGRAWAGCADVLASGGIFAFWVHDFFRPIERPEYIPFHAQLLETVPAGMTLRTIVVWDRYLTQTGDGMPAETPDTALSRLQYILILQNDGTHPRNEALIRRSLLEQFWQPVWRRKIQNSLLGSRVLYRVARTVSRWTMPNRVRGLVRRGSLVQEYYRPEYATECPPDVARMLIRKFSRPGDTVLDPFLGSGTTMQVAEELGRHSIGIEINRRAVDPITHKVGPDNLRIVEPEAVPQPPWPGRTR